MSWKMAVCIYYYCKMSTWVLSDHATGAFLSSERNGHRALAPPYFSQNMQFKGKLLEYASILLEKEELEVITERSFGPFESSWVDVVHHPGRSLKQWQWMSQATTKKKM